VSGQFPLSAVNAFAAQTWCILRACRGRLAGSAEAQPSWSTLGFSPFIISMGMVMGAFVARWTVPTLLKALAFYFRTRRKTH